MLLKHECAYKSLGDLKMQVLSQEAWRGLRFYSSKEIPGAALSAALDTTLGVGRLLNYRKHAHSISVNAIALRTSLVVGEVFLGESSQLFPPPFSFPFPLISFPVVLIE